MLSLLAFGFRNTCQHACIEDKKHSLTSNNHILPKKGTYPDVKTMQTCLEGIHDQDVINIKEYVGQVTSLHVFMLTLHVCPLSRSAVISSHSSLHWSNYSSEWDECIFCILHSPHSELDLSQTLTWPHRTSTAHGGPRCLYLVAWHSIAARNPVHVCMERSHRKNSKGVFSIALSLRKEQVAEVQLRLSNCCRKEHHMRSLRNTCRCPDITRLLFHFVSWSMEIVRSDPLPQWTSAHQGRVQRGGVSHPAHWLQWDAPRLSGFLDSHIQLEPTEFRCDGTRGTLTCRHLTLTCVSPASRKEGKNTRATFEVKAPRFRYCIAGNNFIIPFILRATVRPVLGFDWTLQAAWRDVGMACTRRTKTLVSTCVILSGMTNIVCLLYVGWVTNYIANIYIKVPMPVPERKLEGEKRGDTLRIIERLDRLENVVNQHIQGKASILLTPYMTLPAPEPPGIHLKESTRRIGLLLECSHSMVCLHLLFFGNWNSRNFFCLLKMGYS